MASPSYGIDVVALALAVVLAAAVLFLLAQLVPQISGLDDAATLERCTLGRGCARRGRGRAPVWRQRGQTGRGARTACANAPRPAPAAVG
jgi:hypothetical protein